jgi:hypothetical protein
MQFVVWVETIIAGQSVAVQRAAVVVFLSFRHFSPFNMALYLGVCHDPTKV